MFSYTGFSQTVTLTGPESGEVEVGIASDFTAEMNFSVNGKTYTITNYVWSAEWLGGGSINGESINQVTITSNATSSTVPIIWGDFFEPGNVNVTISVNGTWTKVNSDGSFSSGEWTADKIITVHKNGIPSSVWISGDNNIQKCCQNNESYELVNYGDGNIFTWTYPSSWTVVCGAGTYKITLKPNISGSGSVSCTTGRSQAIPTYHKTTSLSISRYNPSLDHYLLVPYPICPGDNFSLTVTALCGASYYNWSLPSGWSISSGQGTHSINVHIGNSPQSGTVSCTANFTGGCSASISRFAEVLTTGPPAPVFNLHNEPGEYDLGYHCGQFNVRPQNGGTRIEVNHINGADTYHWTVSAPWSVNPAYSSYPWTTITGPSNAPNTGTITVRAVNCIGEGASSSQVFYREKDYWCTHSYPCYCECCQPPGAGEPPHELGIGGNNSGNNGTVKINQNLISEKKIKSDIEFKIKADKTGIYPNPNTGEFTIYLTDIFPDTRIQITDIKGKIIQSYENVNQYTQIEMKEYPKGIYFVQIYIQKEIKTLKLIKQ